MESKYKVIISEEHLDFIFKDGMERYPHESCGLILGDIKENTFICQEIHKAKNLSDNPIRFILDPVDFIKIQEYADRKNIEIIGVYHTHPDHPPIASQYDLEAAVDGLVYIIMSVWNGNKRGDTKAYILTEKRTFIEIPIEIKKI